MEFRTIVDIPVSDIKIDHKSQISMFGSCFIENIGNEMAASKFKADVNPFGVLYNPISICNGIDMLIENKPFSERNTFQSQGLYHSFYHHSRFSSTDKELFLQNINQAQEASSKHLQNSDILLVTFGTAFTYLHKERNIIVGNCHKLAAKEFDRRRLDIETIVDTWNNSIVKLKKINPKIHIIFTVSPIRHMKDGAHENQLSKALLLFAIDTLIRENDNISYFPAYEIVLDELRDYRFYSEDMTHPNATTVKYIWERFSDTFFSEETVQTINDWKKIRQSINHRPFNTATEEYKLFLKQTLLKLVAFSDKYPYIYCKNEITELKDKIQY